MIPDEPIAASGCGRYTGGSASDSPGRMSWPASVDRRTWIAHSLANAYAFASQTRLLQHPLAQLAHLRLYFAYKRHLEDPLSSLGARHPELFKGGHLLDVGANFGYTATVLASLADEASHVYAFEPDEKNIELLRRACSLWAVPEKVIPVMAAVGEKDGSIEFRRSDARPGDHRVATESRRSRPAGETIVRVPLLSIDRFVEETLAGEPVSFIKIDVQGYEPRVCRGMERTLDCNPGASILIEYAPADLREMGFAPEQLTDFFEQRDYLCYLVERRRVAGPMTGNTLRSLVAGRKYVDILCCRTPLSAT
jgi:FkbM family methyltransferase